jgi:CRP-like cAMP-binding protein
MQPGPATVSAMTEPHEPDLHTPESDAPQDDAALVRGLVEAPALAGLWTEVSLAPNELLFAQGDPGDAFYTVVTGELDIFAGEDLLLERIGPGASLGEIALLDGGVRAASVKAITAARLQRLDRDAFLETLPDSPELGSTVISILETRIRRMTHYVDYLTTWAGLVAEGDYDSAQAAIVEQAKDTEDANLGRFVQTFTGMVSAVQAREAELRREVQRLRIQIDRKEQAVQVAEITGDDYFRDLQQRARGLRSRVKSGDDPGQDGGEAT